MKLTCECFGAPNSRGHQMKRVATTKKSNCPFSFRAYVFDEDTAISPQSSGSNDKCVPRFFQKGVYIYEYPTHDHTCQQVTLQNISKKFNSIIPMITEAFNPPSTSTCTGEEAKFPPNLNETTFWETAMTLYKSSVPQDKANAGIRLFYIHEYWLWNRFNSKNILCKV